MQKKKKNQQQKRGIKRERQPLRERHLQFPEKKSAQISTRKEKMKKLLKSEEINKNELNKFIFC
jgi:hypothetical protein